MAMNGSRVFQLFAFALSLLAGGCTWAGQTGGASDGTVDLGKDWDEAAKQHALGAF